MSEEEKKYEPGQSYTLKELLIEQFKILHETTKKEETTAIEKVELSNAMAMIYEVL